MTLYQSHIEPDGHGGADVIMELCIEYEFVPYCTACGKPCFYETLCGSCGDLGEGCQRQCLVCGQEE